MARGRRDGELDSIVAYHRGIDAELPNEQIHASIHMIVENQAAMPDETPVAETLERLTREGLDRHDAIHSVGEVLAGDIWEMMGGGGGGKSEHDQERYDREIRALTARDWLEKHGIDLD